MSVGDFTLDLRTQAGSAAATPSCILGAVILNQTHVPTYLVLPNVGQSWRVKCRILLS